MGKEWNVACAVLGIPGFLMQTVGMFTGQLWLTLGGTLLLMVAMALHYTARGQSILWALWGVVPVMGFIVCISPIIQESVSERESLDEMLLAEDPHIHPDSYQAPPPMGGGVLLAVMLPIGIALLFYGDRLPHLMEPGSPVVTEALQAGQEEPLASVSDPAPAAASPAAEEAQESQSTAPVQEEPAVEEGTETAPTEPSSADVAPAEEEAGEEGENLAVESTPDPEPEPEPEPEPKEPSLSELYGQIGEGMSYEEVREIMGREGILVAGTSPEDGVVRWTHTDASYFMATFRNGALSRLTPLRTRVARKPPPPPPPPPEKDAEVRSQEPPPAAHSGGGEQLPPPESLYEEEPEEYVEEIVVEPEIVESEPAPRITVVGGRQDTAEESERRASKGRLYRRPRLPRYYKAIRRGPYDVHIINGNDFSVDVGLRSGKSGRDFTLRPGGTVTFYLANGDYSLHYLDAEKQDEVHNGGGFSVSSPAEPIVLRLR